LKILFFEPFFTQNPITHKSTKKYNTKEPFVAMTRG